MDIIQKIRERRKELKLSQKQVAEMIGISQAAYAKIEKGNVQGGTKSISITNGKSIAQALNVSFSELFEIEIPNDTKISELAKENEQLKTRISELTEQLEDKRRIIKFLSDNDFTLDIASRIRFVEEGRQFTDFNDPDWLDKSMAKRAYDPGDKQSQIRYIEKWFDKLGKGKKE